MPLHNVVKRQTLKVAHARWGKHTIQLKLQCNVFAQRPTTDLLRNVLKENVKWKIYTCHKVVLGNVTYYVSTHYFDVYSVKLLKFVCV